MLPFAERVEFEARLSEEPALRKQVFEWEARLALLDEQTQPVPPPEGLLTDIKQRLFGSETREPNPAWRWFSAAAFAGLLGLALLTTLKLQDQALPTPDVYATTLQPLDASDLQLVAVYDSALGQLRLNRTSGRAAPDRVFELWLIPAGATPVSLGLLPEQNQSRISLPQDLRERIAGATLAVSDEPPGGSTTGAPTGAVLSAGELILL